MVKVYYDLINAGLCTVDKVPVKWRAEVQAMLNAD